MKKVIFLFSILYVQHITQMSLRAQTTAWDADPAEIAVKGLIHVASSIISDSFIPMTHYQEGEYMLTLVPAYFRIKTAYDDPEIKGDDLGGMSCGMGGGYALSNALMLYGIFAYMDIDGNVKGELYGEGFGAHTADTEYTLYSFYTGIGYDLLDQSSTFSLPLYLGVGSQHYSAEVNLPLLSYNNPPAAYDLEAKVTGEETLYYATIACAFSYEIAQVMRITPYFLYSRSLNKPELTGKVVQNITAPVPGTISEERSITLDPVHASMVGLALSYLQSEHLSFSLSIGGLLTSQTDYYNKHVLDGLEMFSIVGAITYTGSIH